MNKTHLPWLLRTGHDLLGPVESSLAISGVIEGESGPRPLQDLVTTVSDQDTLLPLPSGLFLPRQLSGPRASV